MNRNNTITPKATPRKVFCCFNSYMYIFPQTSFHPAQFLTLPFKGNICRVFKYSACCGGCLNESAPNLKPKVATLRLPKCGAHFPGPHPICQPSLWVIRCRGCTWSRRGDSRGGQECQVLSHAAGRAARRQSPRARAPAPWPRPAPARPARIGAAGCRSPRSGEGAPPAAVPLQRTARCSCDRGFPVAWAPGPASGPPTSVAGSPGTQAAWVSEGAGGTGSGPVSCPLAACAAGWAEGPRWTLAVPAPEEAGVRTGRGRLSAGTSSQLDPRQLCPPTLFALQLVAAAWVAGTSSLPLPLSEGDVVWPLIIVQIA